MTEMLVIRKMIKTGILGQREDTAVLYPIYLIRLLIAETNRDGLLGVLDPMEADLSFHRRIVRAAAPFVIRYTPNFHINRVGLAKVAAICILPCWGVPS